MNGRNPKGIRRHYSEEEVRVVQREGISSASRALGRTSMGVESKLRRISGVKSDDHVRDDSGKYRFQEETIKKAENHGKSWSKDEDEFLMDVKDGESLKDKALSLGRTYRAAESRRRDLLRMLDN